MNSTTYLGSPLSEIRWYHGSEDVTNSHNYEVVSTAKGRTSLRIPEVFMEDEGEFTCRASNKHGEASCTAELILQSKRCVDVQYTYTRT